MLPIHDYGVQKGFALTYGKKEIPKPRELAAFGERWRPYRTVASWYMWRAVEHYGKTRKITKSTKSEEARQSQRRNPARRPARQEALGEEKNIARKNNDRKGPRAAPL